MEMIKPRAKISEIKILKIEYKESMKWRTNSKKQNKTKTNKQTETLEHEKPLAKITYNQKESKE